MWYVGRQNIGERGPSDVKGNSKAESGVEVKDGHHYWRYRRARKVDKRRGGEEDRKERRRRRIVARFKKVKSRSIRERTGKGRERERERERRLVHLSSSARDRRVM